ncbi:hypothetical protein K788_0001873 (plasmid) [Paraburkholderia caribensis MBA4]|uniref:Uncharacterized protein n=2 Tax=Paraburkholderia caribensis TaxID=75105 RepID=A0A0P0RQD9_9BURK|nr:hypothetical protein K788_0001873 [Paraburkholderia caribensis MBA4]
MLSTRNPAEPVMNELGLVTISVNELRRVKVSNSAFLLTDDASFMTWAIISVDGPHSVRLNT